MTTIAEARAEINANGPKVLATGLVYNGRRSRLKVYVCQGGRKPKRGVDAWAVEIGELETSVREAARLYSRGYLVFAGEIHAGVPTDKPTKITIAMARAIDASHYS